MENNGNMDDLETERENGNARLVQELLEFGGIEPDNGSGSLDIGDAFGSLFRNAYNQATGRSSTGKRAWYYNMKHKHRGVALIFNHENFVVGDLKTRLGTEVDCFKLGEVLQGLGFSVTTYTDLTYKEMDEKLDYWAQKDYTDYDCILVTVMSHGEQGIIYAKDAPYKPEDKLWGRFTGEKCITLAGKPKLFFIQACQGDRLDGGVLLSTQVDGGPSSFRIPNHADFLIAYSTIPGYYSWRNTNRGSWFIQQLCFGLDEFGFELDLLSILTFVNRQVAIDGESNCPGDSRMHGQKQIPCITSMLTRLVKFEKKAPQ